MKYELDKKFSFCGFKGLPYCVDDNVKKNRTYLDRENFEFLYRLASHIDINDKGLSESEQTIFDSLIKDKLIRELPPDADEIIPEYREYKNHSREEVHWSITGRCNYRCKHCLQSAPDAAFGEPSLEQCLDTVRQIKECGILRVGITGGEPLIRSDFWQIVDALTEADIAVSAVYSNGWLINEKLIDEFDKRKLHPAWQISFDGIGTHDQLRGVDGAEERAINAIKLLKSRNYKVGCAYSLFKGNTHVFNDSLKLLEELGVSYIKTGYTAPQGEFVNHPELQLSDDDMLEFYKKAIPEYLKTGRHVSLQCEGLFFGNTDEAVRKQNKSPYTFLRRRTSDDAVDENIVDKFDLCGVLRRSFYIGPEGRVIPCMGIDGLPGSEKFPNIREMPLSDILSDSWYIEATSFRMKDYWDHLEECRDCKHKLICRAGCRAMAMLDNSGDYLTKDSRICTLVKNDWAGKIQKCIDECKTEQK